LFKNINLSYASYLRGLGNIPASLFYDEKAGSENSQYQNIVKESKVQIT